MSANRFGDFQKIVEAMEGDFEKFYDKEVGAAGTRVRKHLQELAKLCKVSTRTVDSWVAQRKVPVIRHSKRCVRFSWPEVLSAFRKREEEMPG